MVEAPAPANSFRNPTEGVRYGTWHQRVWGMRKYCSGWVPSNRANALSIDVESPLQYPKGVRAEASVLWQSVQSGRESGSGSICDSRSYGQ